MVCLGELIVFSRRRVLVRREATALLARRSRSVSRNTKRNDEYSGPKPYSSRPPRLSIKSRTMPRPRAGFNRPESEPLSAMMQLTTWSLSDNLILISQARPSKHACRAELVTSSWMAIPRRQHRSASSGKVSV